MLRSLLRLLLGPFQAERSTLAILSSLVLIALLTLLTQIGGLVFWLAQGVGADIRKRFGTARGIATFTAFVVLYGVSSLAIVPRIAEATGRVPLGCLTVPERHYAPSSLLYCALNRHYVRPDVRVVLEGVSNSLAAAYPGTIVSYLDGSFPFFDGFPLLPHRSHDDGRKLDLALFYRDRRSGAALPEGGAWPLGYWSFAPAWAIASGPTADSRDGPLRWRMTWIQGLFGNLSLDRERTAEMLRYLSSGKQSAAVQRVFIESYLRDALGVRSPKIGIAGWNAARHDDHIHFQVF